ncbi:uncharacterized protein BP5553_06487 [Venustampulla echinocandica]|uniref:Major facilitator superfamily (MFS) profile domain-containing protein n=1 Tax=Venustampulla echinocandica TaxID=2656787 RepID=A0A370TK26_9HELO|nr:uncharacterized protein BP5553_06487 [Venustampulla echinocandica]RDL35875.1 hypothetical protein BP5553_06487 [Venustampulla echinocandica]
MADANEYIEDGRRVEGESGVSATRDTIAHEPPLNSTFTRLREKNNSNEEPTGDIQPDNNESDPKSQRGIRFWCIILALCVSGILSALEGTVVSTALPTIVHELGGSGLYIWTVNGYFLTSMVFQPLYGQTANIFGRRWLMILAITLFIVGSAIGGASQSISMLIAGRVVQGTGGGGITVISNLIISDIVPLRERGAFMAIIFGTIIVGTGIGPFVGGIIVQNISWRWVFLINLPIGGLALLIVVAFLQVTYRKEATAMARIKRIDFLGNTIFIASLVAILLALTWAGSTYPWSSWRILVPLLLGFAGIGIFSIYESSRFCVEPTMPPHLFMNRTSVAAFILTFIQTAILYWVMYYMPVYFQGVRGSSPSRSGIQLFPTVLVMIPFAAIGGKLLAIFGKYRPFHFVGFSLIVTGLGCLTLLRSDSSTASWVCFQAIIAAGLGFVSSSTLPAVLAPLEERDVATATGTWGFLRGFAVIWGVTIPGAIFNNQFDHLSYRVSDPATRNLLTSGHAYEHATSTFVNSLPDTIKGEIISVYSDTLKLVWQVAIGVAGVGVLLVFMEKEIKLRTGLNTEFGMKREVKPRSSPDV